MSSLHRSARRGAAESVHDHTDHGVGKPPAGSAAARRWPYRALGGVAILVQGGLLSWLFVIGVGLQDGQTTGDRSGWLYVASLAQATVILVVALVLL